MDETTYQGGSTMLKPTTPFGADLRKRRKQLGLSQEKLARLIGITGHSYSRWESGKLGCRHKRPILLFLEVLAQRQAQGLGGKVDAAVAGEV